MESVFCRELEPLYTLPMIQFHLHIEVVFGLHKKVVKKDNYYIIYSLCYEKMFSRKLDLVMANLFFFKSGALYIRGSVVFLSILPYPYTVCTMQA